MNWPVMRMTRSTPVCFAAVAWLAAGAALAQAPPAEAPPAAAPAPAAVTAPTPAAPPPADEPPPAPATVAPPAPVKSASLRPPDLFAATTGPTGISESLWQGSSADLARTVFPLVAQKPLTLAGAAFAHRLLVTGGQAPDGAEADADLAAARIGAVLALGDPTGARIMLDRTPGVSASPALSQVSAETQLVLGQTDQACKVGEALTQGKDQPYFRRLRAFCLIRAGAVDEAQLAYDLADAQAKDAIYKRLIGAALFGTAPGAPSLRNGLDLALSQQLKLDLTPALDGAWAPILAVLSSDPAYPDGFRAAATAARLKPYAYPDPSVIAAPVLIPLQAGDLKSARAARVQIERNDAAGATVLELALIDAALTTAEGRADAAVMDQLVERGTAGEAADRLRAQQAAALYAALGAPMSGQARAQFAAFDLSRSSASQARMLELDLAPSAGDRALLALWLATDAGSGGPAPVDRARIVRVLSQAGFKANAQTFALEGLIGLLSPPPEAAPSKARQPVKRGSARRRAP